MQTKKRAKPVKFGKPKEQVKKTAVEKEIEEKEIKEKITEEKEETKETKAKEAERDVEVEETDEEVKEEDEPEEVHLGTVEEAAEESKEMETEEIEETEGTKGTDGSEEKKEEESPFGSFTTEEITSPPRQNPIRFFLVVAFVTFLVGLAIISGASYFFSTKDNKPISVPGFQSSPTEAPSPTDSPTPEPPDLSAYTISVLNGSGLTGEAAKVKTALEDKGYKVGSVGNADTSDYTKTVVSAKKAVDEKYLNALINELKKSYKVNSVVESLSSGDPADVVVTIGSSTSN